jgi:hypothetical protein
MISMKYLAFLVLFLGLPVLAHAATTTDAGFIPLLTNVPFLEDLGNASTLEAFLNDIYRLCIGAAAVLAVLQIMRAGIIYMGGDSITEKKEAKDLIAMSIGGLILVLSPVILFSIINPDILSLRIGGIDKLKTDVSGDTYGYGLVTDTTDGDTSAACKAKGGTAALFCSNATTGSNTAPAANKSCPQGSVLKTSCGMPAGSDADVCKAYAGKDKKVASNAASCAVQISDSYTKVPDLCCSGLLAGNQCCAKTQDTVIATSTETAPTPLTVLKYVYVPLSGSTEDLGPTPNFKTSFDAQKASCTKFKGTLAHAYGTRNTCSASDLAALSDARKDYVKCVSTTVSCNVP